MDEGCLGPGQKPQEILTARFAGVYPAAAGAQAGVEAGREQEGAWNLDDLEEVISGLSLTRDEDTTEPSETRHGLCKQDHCTQRSMLQMGKPRL